MNGDDVVEIDAQMRRMAESVLASLGVEGAKRLIARATEAGEAVGGKKFRRLNKNRKISDSDSASIGNNSPDSSASNDSSETDGKENNRDSIYNNIYNNNNIFNNINNNNNNNNINNINNKKNNNTITDSSSIIVRDTVDDVSGDSNSIPRIVGESIDKKEIFCKQKISKEKEKEKIYKKEKEKEIFSAEEVSRSLRNQYIEFLRRVLADEGLAIETRLRAGQELAKLLGWAGMGDDEIRRVADADPAVWVQAIDVAVKGLELGGSRHKEIARRLMIDHIGLGGGASASGDGGLVDCRSVGVGDIGGVVDPVEMIHGKDSGEPASPEK